MPAAVRRPRSPETLLAWVLLAASLTTLAVAVKILAAARRIAQDTPAAAAARADSLQGEVFILRDRLALSERGVHPAPPFVHPILPHELARLTRAGLADPILELDRSLKRRLDLIPQKPVLSGEWSIFPVIISDRYAFARFGDGHVGGSMFLEYTLEGGSIRWRRLDVDRDGRGADQ